MQAVLSKVRRPNVLTIDRKPLAIARWGFPEWFVVSQMVLPALLYLPGTQAVRVPIRVSAYALSIAAMIWWLGWTKRASRPHPARPWLVAAMGYLALMIAHPTTNSFLAGAAQVGLYFSILAPVFWAPDMVRDPARLWRLLGILLVCNGVNAGVGILQVYDPDRWLPKEYSTVVMETYGEALNYIGPNGERIVRPPGLSDSPGAVCAPASAAALLGLIFCVQPGLAMWKRGGALACAFAGIAAIYLSNVRSSLVVVVGSVVAFVVILYIQKERRRASLLLGLAGGLVVGGLAFATILGGQGIWERFATLIEDDPRRVYYQNRGNQVHYAFDYFLAEYPLGAGLGRWGMMRHYFGDEDNPRSPSIWAEIQFPAFILDGGIVLLVAYTLGVVRSAWNEFQIARKSTDPQLRGVAAAVFATNLGTVALMFSYVPFLAPIGVQFWFLAGCLHGAARADKTVQPEAESSYRRPIGVMTRRRRTVEAAV